ncbi:MAG: recombinase family protein [Clostridia bacterium]|nr:recombinase family protein [Clostridia bacterium]
MLERTKKVIFKVAIYIRLSKEDMDRGYDDSESVKNQKILLEEYVKNLGEEYELIGIYIDQGYTGTNFNRPEFTRMINDIEQDKINMVVTKDLSRLGRDYIGTGEYIENWFPEKNIRYVSVNDGIDTFIDNNGNNDIAPFKSILNDMYSKDLSKKIRTALHTMQKQGKWVGGKTPLGYVQDKKDKNHLVICEEEAKIVRTIFNMAKAGKQLGVIRDYLNDNKIPTASSLRYNKVTSWSNKTIKNILGHEIYIGTTIQNKRSRISYKNRKMRENPKEQWYVIENTHEPIIDKKTFEAVQKMSIVQKYERCEKKNYTLLDGLLYCYECDHKIGIKKETRTDKFFTICNNYRRNSKLGICTCHGFNYEYLEDKVLKHIKDLFQEIDSKKIELNITDKKSVHDYKKLLENIEKEIELIKNNIDKMYMDKLEGKITEEIYERVLNKYNEKIKERQGQYEEIKKNKKELEKANSKDITKLVKELLKLENPTPELMKIIINKIKIHQDKQVDIYLNFNKINEI